MSTNGLLFQRLFNYIPDIGIRLGNCAYVRTFSLGNNWSRIRLGALVAIMPNSTSNHGGITCHMGLASTGASPACHYSGVQFIGAQLFPSGTATFAANSGNPCYSGTANIIRRVDRYTVASATGATNASIAVSYTGARMRRTPVIVDITRPQGGGGLYTVTVYSCTTTTVVVDYRPDHLMQAIDNWGTPIVNGQTLTAIVNNSVNASETFGLFDQFEIFWSKYRYELEVYALGATALLSGYYDDAYGGGVDAFTTYGTAAAGTGTVAVDGPFYGTGFSGGTLVGYSNPVALPYRSHPGTALRFPYEDFSDYPVGAVTPGLINAGTSWATPGVII